MFPLVLYFKKEGQNMAITTNVKKAIKQYGLKEIHTGSLSNIPNNRYLRSTNCFNVNELGNLVEAKNFVIVFNYYNKNKSQWTVYETPYTDFAEANDIYQKEHWRRLWDSSQMYYDNGKEVILLSVPKEQ